MLHRLWTTRRVDRLKRAMADSMQATNPVHHHIALVVAPDDTRGHFEGMGIATINYAPGEHDDDNDAKRQFKKILDAVHHEVRTCPFLGAFVSPVPLYVDRLPQSVLPPVSQFMPVVRLLLILSHLPCIDALPHVPVFFCVVGYQGCSAGRFDGGGKSMARMFVTNL